MAIKHTKFNGYMVVYNESTEPLSATIVKEHLDFLSSKEPEFFNGMKWVLLENLNCNSVVPNAVPVLCRIAAMLEQQNIKCSVVGNSKVLNVIEKQGVERILNPFDSVDSFSNAVGLSAVPNRTHVKVFLNTMVECVSTSMKTMLESEIKSSKTTLIDNSFQVPNLQIGAIAGIVSTHFNGSLTIGFDKVSFMAAMTRFLQMEVTEVTPVIKDGAAELLNVIIGQTKIVLNERGFAIQQVIPSVVSGDKIQISPSNKQKAIFIEYDCDFGKFCIILSTNVGA